jgi:hypothetical protein
MKRITAGENVLFKRDLKKADGSDLLLADLLSVEIEIYQGGSVLIKYAYGTDGQLRAGDTPHQIILEITPGLSDTLKQGKVAAKWTLKGENALFTDGVQVDIIREELLDVR